MSSKPPKKSESRPPGMAGSARLPEPIPIVDEGKRAELIRDLCERAWNQFNERRKYEIQIALATWTALILAVAGLLNLREKIIISPVWPWVVAAGVVALHGWWCYGIWRSNRRDRDRAIEYQDWLNRLVAFAYTVELKEDFKRTKQRRPLQDWSFLYQVGMTTFLALCFVYVALATVSSPQSDRVPSNISKVTLQRMIDSLIPLHVRVLIDRYPRDSVGSRTAPHDLPKGSDTTTPSR